MIIGIIPARFSSTRFPGKPLAKIGSQTMIQRVYQQAQKSQFLSQVIVATDDEKIVQNVEEIGGQVLLTSPEHLNGTSRCAEVAANYDADYFLNIQGDEPFIQPEQIDLLAREFNEQSEIITLKKGIASREELINPNVVKVVTRVNGDALYFSRSVIPHMESDNFTPGSHFKHLGIYGYRKDILQAISKMKSTSLEEHESLEQLKWLENGLNIRVFETVLENLAVDTPEDLKLAYQYLNEQT